MSKKNTPRSGMWLDLLPLDVCKRLACHISKYFGSVDVLHLAESSERQCEALLDLYEYKFRLVQLQDEDEYFHRWLKIFAPRVRNASLAARCECNGQDDWWDSRVLTRTSKLFAAKSLRELSVYGSKGTLMVVAKTHKLKKLTVYFDRGHYNYKQVGKTLFKLKSLESLKLVCGDYDYVDDDSGSDVDFATRCLFQNRRFLSSSKNVVAEACPNLKALFLSCDCFDCSDDLPLWKALPLMPNLRETEISEEPPSSALEKLKHFDAVHVLSSYRTAIAIGIPVKVLRLRSEVLSGADVAALRNLWNLEELLLLLGKGAERKLHEATESMPNLQVLQLRWTKEDMRRYLDDSEDDFGDILVADSWECEAKRGSILKAIRTLPKLKELELKHVKVSMTELKEVMKVLGVRLNAFSFPVTKQKEAAEVRLGEILRTAVRHNPFLLDLSASDVPSRMKGKAGVRYETRSFLRKYLRALKKNAPEVCTDCLESVIDRCTMPRRRSVSDDEDL